MFQLLRGSSFAGIYHDEVISVRLSFPTATVNNGTNSVVDM